MFFIPYEPHHLAELELQAAQSELQAFMAKPGYAEALSGPHVWTGIRGGHVVGCAGIQPIWPGRGHCWALFSPLVDRRVFAAVHIKVRNVIAAAHADGLRRIETTVDAGFDAGHRWVRALGFEGEGLARCFTPAGRDHVRYARIAA